jgi:exportin-7
MDLGQLAQVEKLCETLYSSAGGEVHRDAQQQLSTLHSSADYLPQCLFMLQNSAQPFCQVVAITSLEQICTHFWNNLAVPTKVDLRNTLLSYLAARSSVAQDFAINSLTKLICRITKLGWFEAQEHRDIVNEISKFLEASVDHNIIGMRLLYSLVDEMNTVTPGKTITVHRKCAVSFRDQGLLQIFQICITTLNNIRLAGPSSLEGKEAKLIYAGLVLANECMSFDFIGTNPEESAEDVSTVQAPSTWKPLVQDPQTMQMFFDYYLSTQPPCSCVALQCLVQLSSVRRSIFTSDRDRAAFLQSLMSGIQSIMVSKKGLHHENNYHEFCRLLGRLKASYQLSELVKIVGFSEWLVLAGDFTVKSLHNWQYSMNSIHYLLALWGRLVAALPYLRADDSDSQRQAQSLRSCVLQVVQAYLKVMLDSTETIVDSDGDIEDPLDDEGSLKEQMERLPIIIKMHYDVVAQYLLTVFEQSVAQYEQSVRLTSVPSNQRTLKILEGTLTWLTYIVGAIIDAQANADARKPQTELLWDGRLSRCVFQVVQIVDFRLSGTQGQGKCDTKLEIALMTFFKAFKKVYFIESSLTSGSTGNMGLYSVPGGSPAHPMLSLALSGGSGSREDREAAGSDAMSVSSEIMCNVLY